MMRIAIFGATRGCGLESLLLLLDQTSEPNVEVHAFVRNKESFLTTLKARSIDASKLQKLHIFVGDALKLASVKEFFQSLASRGHLDHVISSLGTLPVYSIWKPLTLQMPPGMEHICSDSMNNILKGLEMIAPQQSDKLAPNLTVVSSNGMGKTSHDQLPMLLKPVCEW